MYLRERKLGLEWVRLQGRFTKQQKDICIWCGVWNGSMKVEDKNKQVQIWSLAGTSSLVVCVLHSPRNSYFLFYWLVGYRKKANAASTSEKESRRWIKIMTSLMLCSGSSVWYFLRHSFHHLHSTLRSLALNLNLLSRCVPYKTENQLTCYAKDIGMAKRGSERDAQMHLCILLHRLHPQFFILIGMARG